MRGLLTILVMLCSTVSYSQVYQWGTYKVQSIRYSVDAVYVRFSPEPAACEGGDQYRMHAKIPNSQSNAKQLTSAVLAAYTSGATFHVLWVSNEGEACSKSHVLNLDMIEFSYK